MNLVIAGTIGLDDIKTPFGDVKGVLGGSGVYSAVAASFFAKSGLISIAGDDFPKGHLEFLRKRGIDFSGVSFSGKTFRWSGLYEFDMNEAKTRATELNSLADFSPKVPAEYAEAKFLFLGNLDPKIQRDILGQMKQKPFVALDTMNFWIKSKREKLIEVINKVDLLVLNEGEARQLMDTPNLIQAGHALLEMGPSYVIIKKGEHGALLFSFDGFFSAPGYPLEEVKDPTGAGDSFAGGLIGYLASTGDVSEKNIRKAVVYGSAVASCCAESFSTDYTKNTTRKEIEERYEVFKKIREF